MPANGAMRLTAGRGATVVAVTRGLTFAQEPRATAGDAVPATLIAIGPIRAVAHTTSRAAGSAITTALPATATPAGTGTIHVAPKGGGNRGTHTLFPSLPSRLV